MPSRSNLAPIPRHGDFARGRRGFALGPLRENEVSAAVRLFERTLDEGFAALPDEARRHYRKAWGTAALAARLQENAGISLLARDEEGRPLGLALGAPPEAGVATIVWLLVAAEERGQGIGRALLEECCRLYRQAGCHKLKLTAPSEAARDFYLHLGMALEGYHPRHWWGRDFWSLGLALDRVAA